jgi:hypothetical protein
VTSRPLRVEELAEFLAFDFDVEPIPKFREKLRLEDPIHVVLSTCSSLLSIVDVEGSPVIQSSHFSVKEFLTSTRLAETSDPIIRRFRISMTSAHTLAAQACVGILLHLDKNITRDGLRKYPLAEYAAKHWLDHARYEQVMPNVEAGIKRLFHPNKLHFAAWVWIYDPTELWHKNDRGEWPPHPSGSTLHYAAICGLDGTIEHLITEHSLDINALGVYKESTPLHQASDKGHVEVVRLLLEYGADVIAQDEDKATPLHRASRSGRAEIVRVLLAHGAEFCLFPHAHLRRSSTIYTPPTKTRRRRHGPSARPTSTRVNLFVSTTAAASIAPASVLLLYLDFSGSPLRGTQVRSRLNSSPGMSEDMSAQYDEPSRPC